MENIISKYCIIKPHEVIVDDAHRSDEHGQQAEELQHQEDLPHLPGIVLFHFRHGSDPEAAVPEIVFYGRLRFVGGSGSLDPDIAVPGSAGIHLEPADSHQSEPTGIVGVRERSDHFVGTGPGWFTERVWMRGP